jgi:phytoene synthase
MLQMTDALLANLTGPDRLAVLYAPKEVRNGFTALLALDRRLCEILIKTSEPIIAQMRFAWWRDRLRDAPQNLPKGEPFFMALQQFGDWANLPDLALKLGRLVDIWEELAVSDEWSVDVMSAFHVARTHLSLAQLGVSDPKERMLESAQSWSVLDLANQLPRAATLDPALLERHMQHSERLPRQLRALAILHRSAILSLEDRNGSGRNAISSSLRLLWSGLTGR